MIFTTPMKQLVAVVLEPDVNNVTRALLELGVMHFVNVRDLAPDSGDRLKDIPEIVPRAKISETRRRIESLLQLGGKTPDRTQQLNLENLRALEMEKTEATLDRLTSVVQEQRDRQSALQQEVLRLQDIQRQIELFGDVGKGMRSSSQYSYLSMQTGTVPNASADELRNRLRSFPAVLIDIRKDPDEQSFLLVGMKRDEEQIDRILQEVGWADTDLGSGLDNVGDDVLDNVALKVAETKEEQKDAERRIAEVVASKEEDLQELWANLRMNELLARVKSHFSRTERTVLFTGWVPAEKQSDIESAVTRACENRCYLEWNDPPKDADAGSNTPVPVELRNPGFLAPFQLLVNNYSVPEYGTVDPTPFVAVAYLAMFGLMFGDAGHGLVLLLGGIIGRLLYRKENNVRKLLTLLAYCGGASVVTGVLFGSYFGIRLFPPVWFDFHAIVSGHGEHGGISNIYDVLAVTVYFGIAVIGLGLVLNWVNLIAKRRWVPLIFDKGGLLGGLIYGAGVWAAMYFVRHDYRQLPDAGALFVLIGIPTLLIGLKPPLEFFRERKEHGGPPLHPLSIVDFIMEWIVEVLEIYSGYLANTLSFMRVAGLGIAHESLMIAFFQIADMVGGTSGFSVWSVLILLIGNVLVIALEGLSAGIQSLRLNYYEFFSKYFSGTGVAYRPVSLRSND